MKERFEVEIADFLLTFFQVLDLQIYEKGI